MISTSAWLRAKQRWCGIRAISAAGWLALCIAGCGSDNPGTNVSGAGGQAGTAAAAGGGAGLSGSGGAGLGGSAGAGVGGSAASVGGASGMFDAAVSEGMADASEVGNVPRADGAGAAHDAPEPAVDTSTPGSDAHPLEATVVITVTGQPTPGDQVMIRRLTARGFHVTPVTDAAVTAAAVAGMDLVVISSSAESGPLGTKIRDVAVPILCIENGAYPTMRLAGLTLNTDYGAAAGQTQVVISGTAPLTAGLTGTVTISNMPGDLGWAVPGPAAVIGATIVGNPAHAAVFGYAQGAQMVGMVAPARRAGYAIREALAAALSGDGGKLFDAAVDWVLAK